MSLRTLLARTGLVATTRPADARTSGGAPAPGTAPDQDERAMRLNGREVTLATADTTLLLDFLRDSGTRSVKRSCEVQICGACSVLVDGLPVSSCCALVSSCIDKDVTTVEGLRETPTYQAIEEAFLAEAAVQCGFCTPGFVVTLWFLIERSVVTPEVSDERLKDLLHGNVCRCTGYEPILRAARSAIDSVQRLRTEETS